MVYQAFLKKLGRGLLPALLLCSSMVYAGNDDVMITRDGSFINVKVLKITDADVRFVNLDKKKQGELNAPTDFVYMIIKEKGNNIFFDEDGNQTTCPQVKSDKKDNVLFLNTGKYFPVYNVAIDKDNITYKQKDSKKAPLCKVAKSDVFLIKNSDGTTTLFNNKYMEKQRAAKAEKQKKNAALPVPPSQTVAPVPATPATKPATGASNNVLKFTPATNLDDNSIINLVYAKQPYTLYGKGTVAEYVFMKGNEQVRLMNIGPTYVQQIVADEKVDNGVLCVYVKQEFYNKKHEPSKGISATFKSYYFPTEIDTTGTFHLTHDISRDFFMLSSRKGYAMLLPNSLTVGEKIQCGTIADDGKNLFGGKVTMKAEYSDFHVEGMENVTTPAGTFDCVRLSGNVSENNSISENKYQYTWWLARGIGFVKYEIKSKNAKNGELPLVITLNKLERP